MRSKQFLFLDDPFLGYNYNVVLFVPSSFAIISVRKRNGCFNCSRCCVAVNVLCPFLMLPQVGL